MFQVWTFRPTHTTLVLLSNRDVRAGHLTRIEIAFGGVEFMALPPVLRDIHIRRAEPDFESRIIAQFGLQTPDDPELAMYRLSDTRDWIVVSGRPFGAEAVRAYDAPLLLFEDLSPESGDVVRWTLL
jgi:hypothetical protein